MDKSETKIIIPNVNDYRAGIPVLTASALEYDIINPIYSNYASGIIVLNPVLRRKKLE